MKLAVLSVSLLLSLSASAQSVVYQEFDVDSAVGPRGGVPYLTTFLQTNLRKPIDAEAKGIGGRVIVKAIVEPNGRVTDITVSRSLRPDLDREAVRVFSRFHAWQPGYKDGKAVRQSISIPITFNPNTPFPYVNGAKISYYDADQKPLPDSSEQARYKQIAPVDSIGLPNGDVVILKRKRDDWKESYRLTFVRKKSGRLSPTGKPVFRYGILRADTKWQGRVFEADEAGTLVSQSFYNNGELAGSELDYHPNGIVARRTDYSDTLKAVSSWYANGQIKQSWVVRKNRPMPIGSPDQLISFWDSTGRQLVTEGRGSVVYQEAVWSRSDTTRQTQFIEQGTYDKGTKQGVWTGRYADGSYFYQEQYEQGICQSGKAITIGNDTVRYAVREQQPEFEGGIPGLSMFLMKTIRYPADAQRVKAQGKVLVSFVVCTDGSLCDYEVLKPVHRDLDQEAVRVVKAMSGRWKPGLQRGNPVRVKYILPINFVTQ